MIVRKLSPAINLQNLTSYRSAGQAFSPSTLQISPRIRHSVHWLDTVIRLGNMLYLQAKTPAPNHRLVWFKLFATRWPNGF
jgi:hypothetical protein